ncbi:hypothetical protein [Streptomyces sp. NPDC059076]|uniref:hypothetical protein n=1 Tax=unclassified Streptomyces TaxID=2593676 RepID=UPI0036A83696
MPSIPEAAPRLHAEDLTAADAESVLAFLTPRLHAQMVEHHGAPGYRTAFAVDAIARGAASTVRYQHQRLSEDDFYDSRDKGRCLTDLKDAWNVLWQAAFPWREEEGYDTARWRHVEYTTAQQAERGEAMKAESAAEYVATNRANKAVAPVEQTGR